MKRVALGLLMLTACGSSPSVAVRGHRDVSTTTESTTATSPASVTTRRTGDEGTPDMALGSPPPPFVPPRPAQREVSAPTTTILQVTKPMPLESELLNCLKLWESGNGTGSSNQYQFDQATWEAAGGKGTPDNADISVQDAVAQNWINKGHLRQAWAAQRGRCFN